MRSHELTIPLTRELVAEEAVSSSWIADLSYVQFKDGTGGVQMTTNNGRTYFIDGVPYDTYEDWMDAFSKGKFWWSDIKYFYT